jgi:hypothetical protein
LTGGRTSRDSGRRPNDGGHARSLAGSADARGHVTRIASPLPKARRTRTITHAFAANAPEHVGLRRRPLLQSPSHDMFSWLVRPPENPRFPTLLRG